MKDLHMTGVKYFLLFSLLLPVLFHNLFAQETQEQIYITLEEAINRSLSQNRQIQASRYGVKKSEWQKWSAWTQLFPRVTLNTRYTWIDDSTFALRDFSRYFQDDQSPFGIKIPQTVFQKSFYTEIDVSMTLFKGTLINGLYIAEANEDIAEYADESMRRNIIFLTIRSYLDVLMNEEILKLQQEYLTLSKLNYDKAVRLHQAGRYSKAEVLRWKVEEQQQQSNTVTSESVLRGAQNTLCRLLNLDMRTRLRVNPDIPRLILDESAKLTKMPASDILNLIHIDDEALIEANSALSVARKNEEVSKLLYRNTYADYLPILSLTYSYAWRENNTIELDDYSPQTLMINFSLPIFTSFQNLSNVKTQYYAYKQSRENFEDELQNTRLILTQTVNNLLNLRTQKELSAVSVDYTERNYRIVEQQKEQGLVSNIDFIDAKLNLQNARLTDISNHYDFITTMVELYYLLGNLELIVNY
jgi:outer membrane protein